MHLAVLCAVALAFAGLTVPAAAAASHPANARHLAGGLPFHPAQSGAPLPYTGIGLGGTALLGALMLFGGLLVRRAAAARA